MAIRRFASLAVALGGLLLLGAPSASAATTMRLDPFNASWTGATTITNTTSDSATIQVFDPDASIHCSSTKFHVDFGQDSSATSITASLTALTLQSCTDTLPVIAVSECRLIPVTGNKAHMVINAIGGNSNTQTITDMRLFCAAAGGTSGCYYTAATAQGSGTNIPSALTFSNVPLSRATSGVTNDLGAACGTSGGFGVSLTHITQAGTGKTATVSN
jgi:hypothetical protein